MLEINFDPFPVLETPDLLLRRIENSDAQEVFIMRSHPEAMKYLQRPPAKTVEDALLHIEKIQNLEKNNSGINWGICLKDESKIAGNICIWNISKEHHRAELGYVLLPSFFKKGIMRQAIRRVITYAFNDLKLHSLEAQVNPLNISSIKVLEKNGFVREGYFKENFHVGGKFYDSAVYSLIAP
jgi:[ribosomal protein S5]-alanine N-acetyltransferase